MPSLWTRMRGIVTANGHARLDAVENPAVMSRQLIREIDDDLQGTRAQLVAALARLRQIEISQRKLRQTAEQHARRARAALEQQEEDQARHQLGLKLKLEAEVAALQELAESQQQWVTSLKTERGALQREREELAAQARLIQLRDGLHDGQPLASGDAYSRVMQRRERMQGYAERAEAHLHTLRAAQDLRGEELGEHPAADLDVDVDAALQALKNELNGKETS